MSFSTQVINDQSKPIAKSLKGKTLIYLTPDDHEPELVTRKFIDLKGFQCPMCRKWLKSINGYKYHITHICKITQKYDLDIVKSSIALLPTEERQIIYMGASSGAGKSYQCAQYINYWLQLFPERPVIMVSRHDHDETFDLPEFSMDIESNLHRIKPDMSWLTDKFQLKDFKNSLVVFDDIMSSEGWSDNPEPKKAIQENKMIIGYLHELILDMCQNGRHENIHMLITSHVLYDKQTTSKILNDATDYMLFPQMTGAHHLRYFCTEYVGLLKAQISALENLKSRWVLIHKNAPKYFMWDHGVKRYDVILAKNAPENFLESFDKAPEAPESSVGPRIPLYPYKQCRGAGRQGQGRHAETQEEEEETQEEGGATWDLTPEQQERYIEDKKSGRNQRSDGYASYWIP